MTKPVHIGSAPDSWGVYPCLPDAPLPIATRTLDHLRSCGPLA